MKTYELGDLTRALVAIGIPDGARMLVHSSLFALGMPASVASKDIPRAVRDELLQHVGDSGTLAVPTFTFAFCKGKTFDAAKSPSVGMGQLSEAVRLHPAARRSKHPMQSIAVVGALAEALCEPDPPAAYAIDGTFGRMLEHDVDLVFIGASIQAASLVHYAEERVGVPYRYYKEFKGSYISEGRLTERSYQMYVRDLTLNPKLVLAPIERELRARGEWFEAPVGGGRVTRCRARAFVAAAERLLRADPWVLVANRPVRQ